MPPKRNLILISDAELSDSDSNYHDPKLKSEDSALLDSLRFSTHIIESNNNFSEIENDHYRPKLKHSQNSNTDTNSKKRKKRKNDSNRIAQKKQKVKLEESNVPSSHTQEADVIKNLTASLKLITNQFAQSNEKIQELETKLKEKKEFIKNENIKMESEIKRFNEINEQHKKSYDEKNRETSSLTEKLISKETEIAILKNKIEETKGLLNEKDEKIASIQTVRLNALTTQMHANVKEKEQHKKSHLESTKKILLLEEKINVETNNNAILRSQFEKCLAENTQEISLLKENVTSKENEISILKNQLKEITLQLDNIMTENNNFKQGNAEIPRLQTQIKLKDEIIRTLTDNMHDNRQLATQHQNDLKLIEQNQKSLLEKDEKIKLLTSIVTRFSSALGYDLLSGVEPSQQPGILLNQARANRIVQAPVESISQITQNYAPSYHSNSSQLLSNSDRNRNFTFGTSSNFNGGASFFNQGNPSPQITTTSAPVTLCHREEPTL